MTRLRIFTCCVAALLTLAACSSKPEHPAPSVSPSPSKSVPLPEIEHLEFYDQFDWYNNGVDRHDFAISEAEQDGTLQYCFENTEYGVTIFVPPHERAKLSIAALHYQGSILTFEMPIFILGYGNVSGVAEFYLEDLTGDGTPELVYIYGGGGTGAWHDDVKVFDLASMKECTVSWSPELLAGDLDVFVGNYNSIVLQDGQLMATVLYTTESGSISEDYAGSLSSPFVFDPDTSVFSPELPCTVTVFDDNT